MTIRIASLLLCSLIALPSILCGGETGKEATEPLRIDDEMPFAGTLTGDWGGFRTDLAAKGIVLDLSYTEYYIGLLDGGVADDAFDFGGRADTLIHADFGKLGLWEGGGFHTHLESRFGEAAERRFPRSGGLWPLNTGVVLPLGGSERLVALFHPEARG